MKNAWFAGSFCPRGATCSEGDKALTPSNGPKIRTVEFNEPQNQILPAIVFPFTDEMSFIKENTNPGDWKKCDGQLLPIAQFAGVFSLLGTMYGGDGRTTFGLPDLRNEDSSKGDYYINVSTYIGYGH